MAQQMTRSTMENLITDQSKHVLTVRISRPAQLNALNRSTITELNQVLTKADADAAVGAVILTGAGEKAFVAGADVKEFAHFSAEEGRELSASGHRQLFDLVEQMRTPVIAAINGFALGGGLELAMAAHLRIAAEHAQLGLPEVTLGVIPGYGGTQRLAQLVGRGKALEMILTAGRISAKEALQWGLVNHVVPADALMEKAQQIADVINRHSPHAIGKAIAAVNAHYTGGVNGMHVEIEAFGDCFATDDFVEGTTAFLEKRKAQFRQS